ncbi:MAG: alpha/beta hydrolase [Candidatus Roizmanbacteria bacterium]|nr:alpha/beta hydrolase [Candidatus Roizmanbacteria bacterium]
MKKISLSLPSGEVLKYKEEGVGKTLILLHGLGVDSVIWERVVPLLQNDFRVLLVDLPGYGLNTNLWNGSFDVFSSFFNTLFSAERDASVVGYSFGGNMLLRYVQKKGVTLPRFIVFLSTPIRKGVVSLFVSFLSFLVSLSRAVSVRVVLFLLSTKVRYYLLKKTGLISIKDGPIIDFCVDSLMAFKNPSYLCKSLSFVFLPFVKKRVVGVGVVGIFGEKDGFVKEKRDGLLLTSSFSDCKTQTVLQTHHLSPLENPEGLVQKIKESLGV